MLNYFVICIDDYGLEIDSISVIASMKEGDNHTYQPSDFTSKEVQIHADGVYSEVD